MMPKRHAPRIQSADAADTVVATSTAVVAVPLLDFNQAIVAGTVSPRSMAKYAQHFAAYCAYATTRDAALEPTTLARWRTALAQQQIPRLAPDTINNKLAAVRSIMVAAAEQGYLRGDQADAFRRARGERQGLERPPFTAPPHPHQHRDHACVM